MIWRIVWIDDDAPEDRSVWRFLAHTIAQVRAARRMAAGWLARALNNRSVGSVHCHGDLGRPAVTALVG